MAGPGVVNGEMKVIHGGLEGHPEAVEAHPGAVGSPWSSGAVEAQF